DRRRIDRVARRLRAHVQRRTRLPLQMEHGLDARHAPVFFERARAPEISPERPDLFAGLRLLRALHAPTVSRRGGAWEGIAVEQDAWRCLAEGGQPPPALRAHGGTPGKEVVVYGLGVWPAERMEPRRRDRMASTGRPA